MGNPHYGSGLRTVVCGARASTCRPGRGLAAILVISARNFYRALSFRWDRCLFESGPEGDGFTNVASPDQLLVRPPQESVRAYVPGTVAARLAAGQENWIGELRVVSVLFVNLPDLSYATTLERAQHTIQYLQQELYRFEGSINKLNLDDKGTSLLAALGLPPLAHEDDPRRAVHAAMAIRQRLLDLGLRSSIGVATGRVFCGSGWRQNAPRIHVDG